MKLVTFSSGSGIPHLGVWLENKILDLTSLPSILSVPPGLPWDSLEGLLTAPGALQATIEFFKKNHKTISGMEEQLLQLTSCVRLLSPLQRPSKIICVGLNYLSHCHEQGAKVPDHPILFAKFPSALLGTGSPVVMPSFAKKLDYEAELAVVIGRQGKGIRREDAWSYIAGYMNFNDISARDIQFQDRQWVRSKSFDTFAPLGPFMVTVDEAGDAGNLAIKSRVNGELRQDSSTSEMIFTIPALIEFISQAATLLPGDIIATGTPAGVGLFQIPPRLLKPGDVVQVEIEGLGVLQNLVVKEA